MSNYTNKLNNFSIKEQEDFMHLIFDVIHIGVSIISLSMRLDSYLDKYDLKEILNSRLKNEQYSTDFEYPIAKVLYQNRSNITNQDDEEFYNRKLAVLRMLISYGADISKVEEKYSCYDTLNLEFMKEKKLINDEIIDFIYH